MSLPVSKADQQCFRSFILLGSRGHILATRLISPYTFAFINLSLPPFAPSIYLSLLYLPIYFAFSLSLSLSDLSPFSFHHLSLFLSLSCISPVSLWVYLKRPFGSIFSSDAAVKPREHLISFVEINLSVLSLSKEINRLSLPSHWRLSVCHVKTRGKGKGDLGC